MTTTEKLLALKNVSPFDRLRDAELILVARSAIVKHYPPGQLVSTDENPLRRLHIVIEGALARPDGATMGSIVGAASLLLNRPLETVKAADTGAVCLLLSRSNLHTTVNECPTLLVGFMDLWGGEPSLIS